MSIPGDLHPIVAQMAPSAEQELPILERGRDIVVTAGAGAGKTRTLVARYLGLLAQGMPLRSTIAITFTEKAAREMRNRVRDEVRRYMESLTLPGQERDAWHEIYNGLDAARISTIHGLCSEILRSHPAEAALDPRFAVLDEGQGNLLRRRAVDETLAQAVEDVTLVPLFELLGERGLRETVDCLLRHRLDASDVFADQPADVRTHWQAALVRAQTQAMDDLIHDPAWRSAAETVAGEKALAAGDRIDIQRREASSTLQAAATANDPVARRSALSRLTGINLTGGSPKAWPGGQDQFDAVKAALKTLRQNWKENTVLHLELTPRDEELAQALPLLRACFEVASARYRALKRERDALDFDDLEAGALSLLAENPAVRARWQAETAALLVDEFQDTNDRQRRLVGYLDGGGGKRFIVGDAKQSIYRFRGADVTVFREERQIIGRANGAVWSLDTSYRGHRALIQALNDLLRPVLGEGADPRRPWVEPFAALQPYREQPGPGFTEPYVECHLALGSKGENGLERAADALAQRLADLIAAAVQVEENGSLRPLDYGDVAILCRASTSFAPYENALERAGIPFLTVSGRGFYGRPEIRDVLNALAALSDPTDDLALAGLLRSPALALSDAGLYWLAAARRGEAFQRLNLQTFKRSNVQTFVSPPHLWDILRDFGPMLPGEDGARAAHAAHLISDLHAMAGRAPVADLLKAFLDKTGYRAALLKAGQVRAARNLAKLLADAHTSGLVGVGEFVEYVSELRDSGTREGEARTTGEHAVQIMSVHAAKGLEFPVVVLGDATYHPPSRNDIIFDPVLGALLPLRDEDKALPDIYTLGKHTADDQEAAEEDRLLYVAATRAREMLIVSACFTTKDDGTPRAPGGWLGRLDAAAGLGLAGSCVAPEPAASQPLHWQRTLATTPVGYSIYGAGWICEPRRPEAAVEPSTEERLPPPLLSPVLSDPVTTDDRTAQQERDPGQRVWRVVPAAVRSNAPGWVVGSIVHDALAVWRFPGDAGGAQFERWAEAHARGRGLTDPHQLADAVTKGRSIMRRFRDHPLYAEMASAERRMHEVPYSRINEDGQVESGIIDALYLRNGVWTIVEFKTDTVSNPARLEALLKEKDYLPQAKRYQASVEQLVGQRPHLILCFLDCGAAVHLHRL
jgi:ATP-dependent helicase/nuclease subunit A